MPNQNFAFASDYATLTDEELATVQGGNSLAYNVGWFLGATAGLAFLLARQLA